jgi:asparagine synthase (glutamine-hydrolysing)
MSGIAGLLALDGSRVEDRTFRQMLMALAHRGRDGHGTWSSGPIAMGHQTFRTTPEAHGEVQPWRHPAGVVVVALDGRIDNRDALQEALIAKGRAPRAEHDAELVLRAYECWGEDFARELVGDFAVTVWDGARGRLVCARDPLGVKPLYYHADRHHFRWSSELHAILEDPAVPRRPNEGMVAEMLGGYLVSREETLWHGLFRLRPGHTLTVSPDGLRLRRYWSPESGKEIRHATDGGYAEHFRTILEEAVRARLRAVGPVGAHLSGGIDSSSVAVLAQRLAESGASPAPLQAFTQSYPELQDDERAFAEETASRWGIKWHAILPDAPGPAYYEGQARRYLDFPDYPNGTAWSLAMTRLAVSGGCRVMLTGVWGNAFLEGSAEHLADLLRAFRLAEALRCARLDTPLLRGGGLASVIFNGGLRPLVPARWRRAIGSVVRRPVVPDFMPPSFAGRVALRDRLRAPEWEPSYSTFAQRGLYRAALSAWNIHAGEITERGALQHGIEERHPFTDRRLVEFCLGLPETQRWRGQTLKVVEREAMRGLVPDSVRMKTEQPELSFLHMEALAAAGGEGAFDRLCIADQGWVDAPRARALYRKAAALYARRDPRYAGLVGPLWTIHGLELWLRAAMGKASPCL